LQEINILARGERSARAVATGSITFATGLRSAATLLSAVLFGVVAAPAVSTGPPAAIVSLSLAYLFVFLLGASYRAFINVWLLRYELVAPSWSGATAASAVAVAIAALATQLLGHSPDALLLGYALAINAAFLLAKEGCMVGGCCGARGSIFGVTMDLRHFEVIATAAILGATALGTTYDGGLAASAGLVAHTGLRLLAHRWINGPRAAWVPLRQPSVELVPLYLLSALTLVL
jgi:hypothetical protein